MALLACTSYVRPPHRYAAPSPRSFSYIHRNEDRSPVWRRWAECLRFNVNAVHRERFPLLQLYSSYARELRRSALSTYLSTAPPTTKTTANGAPNAVPNVLCSVCDDRETAAIDCATDLFNKNHFLHTKRTLFFESSVHPTILLHKTMPKYT